MSLQMGAMNNFRPLSPGWEEKSEWKLSLSLSPFVLSPSLESKSSIVVVESGAQIKLQLS